MKRITVFIAGFVILMTSSVVRPDQDMVCKNGVCSFDPDKKSSNKNHSSQQSSVIALTAENFATFIKNETKPVVVDFYAEWCGPCKNMKPIVDELAREAKEYVFASIDGDKYRPVMMQYGIQSFPTFVVFKNGAVWGKVSGWMPKEQLLKHIQDITCKEKPVGASQDELLMQLFMAISERNMQTLNQALASGVDVNGKLETPQGTLSALSVAVFTGNNEIIDLLVKAGAKIDKTLEESIKKQLEASNVMIDTLQKNLEYCKNKLASLPGPIKQTVKITGPDLGIQFIQTFGNPEQLKKLIDQGADVNIIFALGKNQVTPLYMALAMNIKPIMDMLIDAGATLANEVVNEQGSARSVEQAIKEDIETSKQGMIKSRERLAYALSKAQ